MNESTDAIPMSEKAECRMGTLYDRTIAALTSLNVEALIALQRECESLSETTVPSLNHCQWSLKSGQDRSEKHQLLMKLLVQTRQNLRVLRRVHEASNTYASFASTVQEERATWQS